MADTKIDHTSNEVQTARLSLPTDKPFRITFDVTPVFGYCVLPSFGKSTFRMKTGPENYDVSITVEELPEVQS